MTDQPKPYQERWDSQKKYYSDKSGENKRRYEALQMITMIGSVLAPVFIITSDDAIISKIIPIVISLIVAISTGTERIKNMETVGARFVWQVKVLSAKEHYI